MVTYPSAGNVQKFLSIYMRGVYDNYSCRFGKQAASFCSGQPYGRCSLIIHKQLLPCRFPSIIYCFKTNSRVCRSKVLAALGNSSDPFKLQNTSVSKKVLQSLVDKIDLKEQETEDVMNGPTAEEVAGLVNCLQSKCLRLDAGPNIVDIVGTGGDHSSSVNISTGASLLAAAAGVKIAKHGNRSVSSACGSADVLEALGVNIDLSPNGVKQCVDEVGIGFMYAPRYHPAMKIVKPVRDALKIRTVFNILGPLLNPAGVKHSLIGVYSTSLSNLMAETLQQLKVGKTFVVHSHGLDELTPMGEAEILEVTAGSIASFRFDPKCVGIKRCDPLDLKGGNATLNATILKDVLGGRKGPIADALCLNAGAALATIGVACNIRDGVIYAQEVLRSGKAIDVLNAWVKLSSSLT